MNDDDPWYRRVMSGAARGPAAAAARAGLALVEPFYSAAARARNRAYDRRPDRARPLPRPVVSVGNVTAGGTGKTPVVRWLAGRLRERGLGVAVLSRGYKAAPGTLGDEQRMLDRLLNGPAAEPAPRPVVSRPVLIRADPDRRAAGEALLREHPEVDLFLLDDGFQHRRLARDLDVVLIRATEPFGFGRVLPRGLLREPLAGLRRAGAFVLTHADGVDAAEQERIEREIRRHNPAAPIYSAVHEPVALRAPEGDGSGAGDVELPLARLSAVRAFAFCGIGNPAGFERELRRLCGGYAGHRWFADHHDYAPADLSAVRAAARRAGADVLVTTEKDWVKVAELEGAARSDGQREPGLPVWRLDVAARFLEGDGERLLEQVVGVVEKRGAG